MVKFYIKTGSSWEFLTEESPRNADRYVVPLPFRDPNLMFPNNKKHAIQRLMGAQTRIYQGQQILPRLSQLYGQSFKK